MAQDGSQPWGGKGAFPFLMHHPKDTEQTSNYGQHREAGKISVDSGSSYRMNHSIGKSSRTEF